MPPAARDKLHQAKTVVVKAGSSILASLTGGVDTALLEGLVAQLSALQRRGRQVVLVSSGAVAAGCADLGLIERPSSIPRLQAAAAVGQTTLMRLYRKAFAQHEVKVAQVLLTLDVLQNRQRYLHARNALRELLSLNVIPVVNENDTVAVEELRLKMGDNDQLAVAVAQLVDADCVILLTDVPGLYDRHPGEEAAVVIEHVEELSAAMRRAAGGTGNAVGSGGMRTKLDAARGLRLMAVPMVVADGRETGVVEAILAGANVGTYFAPQRQRRSARQQWIAFGRAPAGLLRVDDGARQALIAGKKSLLAIGIRDVEGDFDEADTVDIATPGGEEFARGLVNFSAAELRHIAGKRSDEFAEILGYNVCETVVHRDNLVVLDL